jgi:hypothetical protein
LRYVQRIDEALLKPTVQTLAVALPVGAEPLDAADAPGASDERRPAPTATVTPSAGEPLVMLMRFGAGNVLYVATDETWRWRYARGETLFERFWLGLIRAMSRDRLARTGRAARLVVSPERAVVEQPVLLALELFDQRLIDDAPASVEVELTRTATDAGAAGFDTFDAAPLRLTLRRVGASDNDPTTGSADSTPTDAGAAAVRYRATWVASAPGTWTAALSDRALPAADLAAEVEVAWPLDELRRPETDHAALAALAEETDGRVIPPAELADIADLLPNRERRRLIERAEPIWDAPITLIIVLSLLTIEWLGRRAIRLI